MDCLECNNDGCYMCKERYAYSAPLCYKCPDGCQTCDPKTGFCLSCPKKEGINFSIVEGKCVECAKYCTSCETTTKCIDCEKKYEIIPKDGVEVC